MLKTTLKRIPLFARINAALKSEQSKTHYREWCSRYGSPCVLDETDRNKWPHYFGDRNSPAPPQTDRLSRCRFFYVGANWDQDRSGLIQGLQMHGEVGVFRGPDGMNQLRMPRDSAEIDICRRANSVAIEAEFCIFARAGAVTAVIGQMWNFAVDSLTLARIRDAGVPIVNIAMDDRHSFHKSLLCDGSDGGVAGIISAITLGATAAPECISWYRSLGVPAVFFPEASDASLFQPLSLPKTHDITFVGANYGFRSQVVKSLRDSGLRVTTYGCDWPEGRICTERIPELFSRSRIVLGIGGILHCKDFTALKLRDFDAPMSGSLYIAQSNPDLSLLFRVGEEIETWSTVHELSRKCQAYLADEAARERIALAGRRRAVKDHTWEHRFALLLRELNNLVDRDVSCS